jgi:hypothetical protein
VVKEVGKKVRSMLRRRSYREIRYETASSCFTRRNERSVNDRRMGNEEGRVAVRRVGRRQSVYECARRVWRTIRE